MTEETNKEEKRIPDYEFHPLAEIFPLMSSDELYQLAEDISKNGLLEPIILFEEKIFDGRNRYRACQMINEMPRYMEFDERLDPLAFVISKNLHRRHLNSAQKAEIGLIILKQEREKAKKDTDLIKKISKRIGISNQTLWQWEKITDIAQEDERIAIARDKVLAGQRSIKSVINDIKQKEKGHRKRKVISKSLRHEVFKRDNYQCVECGSTSKDIILHIDHIIPISQDGTDELSNLQTLCEKCNLAKSDRKWIGNSIKKTKLLCDKCSKIIEEGDFFYSNSIQLNQLCSGDFCKIAKSEIKYYHKQCYLILGGDE